MFACFRLFFLILTIAWFSPCSASGSPAVGTWEGTLVIDKEIGFKLEFSREPNEQDIRGFLYALDENNQRFPLDSVAVKGNSISFASAGIFLKFSGTISNGNKIEGTWYQGDVNLPVAMTRETNGRGIIGNWSGQLIVKMDLRLVFQISENADGLSAVIHSPDQGNLEVAAERVLLENGTLALEFSQIGASFSGALKSTGQEIEGSWSQEGEYPLALKRVQTQ